MAVDNIDPAALGLGEPINSSQPSPESLGLGPPVNAASSPVEGFGAPTNEDGSFNTEAIKGHYAQHPEQTPSNPELRALFDAEQAQTPGQQALDLAKGVGKGALGIAHGLFVAPVKAAGEVSSLAGNPSWQGVKDLGAAVAEGPAQQAIGLARQGYKVLDYLTQGLPATFAGPEAKFDWWKQKYLYDRQLASQKPLQVFQEAVGDKPEDLLHPENFPGVSEAAGVVAGAKMFGGAARAVGAGRALLPGAVRATGPVEKMLAQAAENGGEIPAADMPSLASGSGMVSGKLASGIGKGMTWTGGMPENVTKWLTAKLTGSPDVAGKLSRYVGKGWAIPVALVGGAPLVKAIAAVKGLELSGQFTTGLGDFATRVATADASQPLGRLYAIAQDATAPTWLRQVVDSPVVKFAAQAAGLAGQAAKVGAVSGAVMGVPSLLSGDNPEEIGENIGGGAAFGAGFGVLHGRAMALREKQTGALANWLQAHLDAGISPETLKQVNSWDAMQAASAEKLLKGGQKIRFASPTDPGSPFAEGAPAAGQAGWSDTTQNTLWVNPDPALRQAGSTLLHEIFHPIWSSQIVSHPEITKALDEALKANGKTVEDAKRTYVSQELGRPGNPADPAAVDARVAQRDASDPAWIYPELLSDAAARTLYGVNLPEAARGARGLQQIGESDTVFPGFEKVLDAPAMRRLSLRAFQDYVAHRAGIDELAPQEAQLAPSDMGTRKAPFYGTPDGREINPYGMLVKNPATGQPKFVKWPDSELKRRSKVEQDALDGYFAKGQDVAAAPEAFWNDARVNPWTKAQLKALLDARQGGTTLEVAYHRLNSENTATAQGSWRKDVGRVTGNVAVSYQKGKPLRIYRSKQGNLLVEWQSDEAANQKSVRWADRKGDLSFELWGGDTGAFFKDSQQYLQNHAEGLPGDANGLGSQKRDVLNAFWYGDNRENQAKNPLRAQLRGSDRAGVIRSLRVDRMESPQVAESSFPRMNWEKGKINFSPSTDPRAVRAAAVQDDQGHTFEGEHHLAAYQAATAAGVKPEDLGKMREGFVTNTPQEFLDRGQGFQRADELSQLKQDAPAYGAPTAPQLVSEAMKPGPAAKPEVAKLGISKDKNNFGDPLGTQYRATPEDWAKWQDLQGRLKAMVASGNFDAYPPMGKENETLKNKYGGNPPMPPAPGEQQFSPSAQTETGKALEKAGFRFDDAAQPGQPYDSILVHHGKQLAGEIYYFKLDPRTAMLDSVEVQPAFRRRGLGTALYAELAARLRRQGVSALLGDVQSGLPFGLRDKVLGGFQRITLSEVPSEAAHEYLSEADLKGQLVISHLGPETQAAPQFSPKAERKDWVAQALLAVRDPQSKSHVFGSSGVLSGPLKDAAKALEQGYTVEEYDKFLHEKKTAIGQLLGAAHERGLIDYGTAYYPARAGKGIGEVGASGVPKIPAYADAKSHWSKVAYKLIEESDIKWFQGAGGTENIVKVADSLADGKFPERDNSGSRAIAEALLDVNRVVHQANTWDLTPEQIPNSSWRIGDTAYIRSMLSGRWGGDLADRILQAKGGERFNKPPSPWDKTPPPGGGGKQFSPSVLTDATAAVKPDQVPELDRDQIRGGHVSVPVRSYHEAASEGNPWVRRSADPTRSAEPTNENRLLMVQFSSDLLNPPSKDIASGYYDKLYSGARPGYARLGDFWEIPQWMGFVAHSFGDADVYVVRDMAQAKQFLNQAGYGRVAFSALDINTARIKELAASYPGKVDVGGYVEEGTFKDSPNVTWHPSVEALAKAAGVPFQDGVDYRHFAGSDVIPRLTMSAGCRHKCAFCSVTKVVTETPEATIKQQADAIAGLGSKLVYLNDKTFGQASNYQLLSDLYTQIKTKVPDFKGFIVQTTAAQLKTMPTEWLKKSGIKFVELGVESYNDPILKEMHKPANVSLINQVTQKLRENGIILIPNIIIGLPGETPETYGRTLQFLKDNRDIISHANIYNLAVYKDAELGKKLTTASDGDFNENVLEKSWHTDPKVHQVFAGEVYGLAESMLDKNMQYSPAAAKEAVAKGAPAEDSKEPVKTPEEFLARVPLAPIPQPDKQQFSPPAPSKEEKAPVFYSQLSRVIDSKFSGSQMPAAQLAAILRNPQNGVKNEEMEWSGLDDFLKGKSRVSKEEVQEFLKANQVRIKEVVKTTGKWNQEIEADTGRTPTKFESYQLPGGKNYRELLMTLPSRDWQDESFSDFLNRTEAPVEPPEALQAARDAYFSAHNQANKNFFSTHWSEPNVLAHTRVNDREDSAGKPGLFTEEIQSDWHQKGRKEGYGVHADTSKWTAKPYEGGPLNYPTYWDVRDEQNNPIQQGFTARDAADAIRITSQEYGARGVPDVPFKTTWHELVLRRLVRMAAEEGKDWLGWTTGEQQAERYDLSKQVSEIGAVNNGDGTYALNAKTGQGLITLGMKIPVDRLADYIGKDLAEKIVGNQGTRTSGEPEAFQRFTGTDLKVGGEGMKGFYDKILVDYANKFGRKFGARAEQRKIEIADPLMAVEKTVRGNYRVRRGGVLLRGDFKTEEEAWAYVDKQGVEEMIIHSLPITPEMKKSVLTEGVAQFSPPAPQADDLKPATLKLKEPRFISGWMNRAGEMFPLKSAGPGGIETGANTHEDWAAKTIKGFSYKGREGVQGPASKYLFDQGWMRVVPYGSDAFMANTHKGLTLSAKQLTSLKEIAQSVGAATVYLDNGHSSKAVWSENDQFSPAAKEDKAQTRNNNRVFEKDRQTTHGWWINPAGTMHSLTTGEHDTDAIKILGWSRLPSKGDTYTKESMEALKRRGEAYDTLQAQGWRALVYGQSHQGPYVMFRGTDVTGKEKTELSPSQRAALERLAIQHELRLQDNQDNTIYAPPEGPQQFSPAAKGGKPGILGTTDTEDNYHTWGARVPDLAASEANHPEKTGTIEDGSARNWRYRPDTKTVYWWTKPNAEAKEAAEAWLSKQGKNEVKQHVVIGGGGAAGAHYTEAHGKGNPSFSFSPATMKRYAKRIAAVTEEKKGATFNVATGKTYVGGKDPIFAVSIYPDRSLVLQPGEKVTPQQLEEFINKNQDLLADKENSVGTWLDPDDKLRPYVDVSYTTRDQKLAEYAGWKYNQIAIWDLKNMKAVQTGGDGKPLPNLVPAVERLATLKHEWELQNPQQGQTQLPGMGRVVLDARGQAVRNLRDLESARPDRDLTPTEQAASDLTMRSLRERVQLLPNVDDRVKVRRAVQEGLGEVAGYLSKQQTGAAFDSGEDWYRKDIEKAEATTKLVFPETKDPVKMNMFKVFLAAFSGGEKPTGNYKLASEAFAQYLKTGEVPSTTAFRSSPEGKARILGRTAEMTADKLNGLIEKTGGEAAFVKYLLTKHPETLLGHADSYGAMDLGPKFGRFFLNLTGHANEVTVDLWATRTWNRWMGTPFRHVEGEKGGKLEMPDIPSDKERALIIEAFQSIATQVGAELGKPIGAMDVQATLWFFEKDLYTARGVRVDRGSFSEAAKTYAANPQHTRTTPEITGQKLIPKHLQVDPKQRAFSPGARSMKTHQTKVGETLVPQGYALDDEFNCLTNAENLAAANPKLRYVEGFAVLPGDKRGAHAWCVGPQGEIVDPYFKQRFPTLWRKIQYREDPEAFR